MASRRRDVVVGQALSPRVLDQLGAAGPIPEPDSSDTPAGSWVHTYRVFTCHGYVNRDNDDHGCLRIERRPEGDGGGFRLRVFQSLLFTEGAVQELRAEIDCRGDRLATPQSWSLAIDFVGPDGAGREDLGYREAGRLDGGEVEVETEGRTLRRPGSRRMATNWGLFEAVQRMTGDVNERFDLYEDLAVLKPEQRLRHRGVERAEWGGVEVEFDRFVQWGRGILPFDYYLDGDRRLAVVTTLSRAYILDGEAEQKTAGLIEGARASARRRNR